MIYNIVLLLFFISVTFYCLILFIILSYFFFFFVFQFVANFSLFQTKANESKIKRFQIMLIVFLVIRCDKFDECAFNTLFLFFFHLWCLFLQQQQNFSCFFVSFDFWVSILFFWIFIFFFHFSSFNRYPLPIIPLFFLIVFWYQLILLIYFYYYYFFVRSFVRTEKDEIIYHYKKQLSK